MNVTTERLAHLLKQWASMISTDEGTQIDESDEQSANAQRPMRES
jgi:hypothetical protein